MQIDEQKLNEFLTSAVSDLAAGYAGVMVSLGSKLGLYKAMAGAGPLNSQEVARRAGCAERYVREWLNSQAAGGYVVYHPSSATYELTPEQAMVLADEESSVFFPPAWEVPASMWFDEEQARPAPDHLRLSALKKLRLRFREQIELVERTDRRGQRVTVPVVRRRALAAALPGSV